MNCSTTRQIKENQTCTMEVHAVKPWLVRMCSKCGLAIGRAPTTWKLHLRSVITFGLIYIYICFVLVLLFFPRKRDMESASATSHAGAAESREENLG